jgi:hypothetical protein
MWRAARLPAKHGPLRIMPASAPLRAGPQPTGPRVERRKRCRPVLAYAGDVKVFVTQRAEFATIHQAIQCFERAMGARLNPSKSKAMVLGGLTVPATELGIDFHDLIKVLCVTFGATIPQSINHSWAGIIHAARALARKAYTKSLCFAQRVRYVNRASSLRFGI